MRTVRDVIAALPRPRIGRLVPPAYTGPTDGPRVGLAVESMKRHVTDEGWRLFEGLERQGYLLCGHRLETYGIARNMTNVKEVMRLTRPSLIVMQDQREWDADHKNFRDPDARFKNIAYMRKRDDLFRMTVIKDAHQRPEYHATSASEIGCHAWITYYHPKIICHMAPYVRPEHLIRTEHCVDPGMIPAYSAADRKTCLLSGAIGGKCYPLRRRLVMEASRIPGCETLRHPGYNMRGCVTPHYLKTLSQYKVAICTSSIFGYSLRKLVEATAAGCAVITDLPSDDVLYGIDGNFTRVAPSTPTEAIADLVADLAEHYCPERQEHYASVAKTYYSWQACGDRLAAAIERMRANYAVKAVTT